MKKFLCMTLSLMVILSLAACSKTKTEVTEKPVIENSGEINQKQEEQTVISGEMSGDQEDGSNEVFLKSEDMYKFREYQIIELKEDNTKEEEWTYMIVDKNIVSVESDKFVPNEESGDIGTRIYTVAGLEEGKGEIIFKKLNMSGKEPTVMTTVKFLFSVDKNKAVAVLPVE